jgi:hypothetical protein
MSAIDEDLDEAHPRAPAETPTIAARYGRTPERKRRVRWIYIGAAAAAAALLTGWAVWSGLDQVSGTVNAVDGGSTILSDRSVSISYQVSMPPGDTASCALQVQNEAHAIVGWRIVKIPASTRSTTTHTHVVLSSERGVTGLIYSCWLT